MRTGDTYVASGKFEFSKVLTSAFVGIVAASILGVVYAVITDFNPFIYLNILVLAGLIFAMSFIIQKVALYGKSRNTMVNVVVGLVVCLFAWYAHWCFYFAKYLDVSYFSVFFNPVSFVDCLIFFSENRTITIGRSTSSGSDMSGIVLQLCYLVEFGAFMWPAIANRKPAYYSEKNQCVYTSIKCFVEKNDYFTQEFEKAPIGSYGFISKMELYVTLNEIPLAHNDKVIKLDFHYCEEDEDDSILTMTEGKLKIDKKKNESTFSASKKLITDIYVDAETEEAILRKNTPPVVATEAETVKQPEAVNVEAEPEADKEI